ncbi:MAG TPA: glycosyltransferase [Gemmataceae bacterium]|jgi:sugar transferase (PEP-CTERM/EpsH1 system associated)|nr:glycosyltransferase [Gemmataceae bacterium]
MPQTLTQAPGQVADARPGRLRVAHVTLGLDVGGQEKLLVEFARHADREGFELVFVSLTGRGQLAADLDAQRWPVVALEQPPGLRPRLILRLARLFRELKVDVVHTHDDKPLLYGAPAARLARVRRVLHTRHGRGFGLSRRQRLLVRLAARLTDSFVCVSDDCAELSRAQGVSARRVRTLRNGIDVSRFSYAGPHKGGPVVTVARLSPEKDLETLVRAAALAAAERPAFRLEVAGDGPCLLGLQKLVRTLGVGDHVRFLGEVRDVPSLLARASLFALSSVSEGISLTLLEAMARGLPAVATRVGGNPEVVADGSSGLLVPPGDPPALARAMLELWGDRSRAQKMGLVGRRRVEQGFDVKRMVARYEALYRGAGQGA